MKAFCKAAAAVLILVLLFTFTACGEEPNVVKIQIIDNSFKTSYKLDEALTLSSAKILVTYNDGTTEVVAVTSDMVTGFDTSVSGNQKTLKVTYKDVSALFTYSVQTSVNVDTAFRMTLSSAAEGDKTALTLQTQNVETVEGGIYAFSFEVSFSNCSFFSVASLAGEGFIIKHKAESNVLSVLIYSAEGSASITESRGIAKILVTLPSASAQGRITLYNVKISNGEKDFVRIPTFTLNI